LSAAAFAVAPELAPAPPPAAHSAREAARTHWQEGLTLATREAWPQAARAFARAARAAPSDALLWVNLANAQRHAGAPHRAIAAARRALQHSPGDPLALRVLGVCLAYMHRYAEAAQVLAELDASGHSTPEIMVQHGSALLSLQQPKPAAVVLLRALALQPDLVQGHAMLAEACREQGMKREALECMKTVLALQPDNVEALARVSFEKRQLCDWSSLDADIHTLVQAWATAVPGQARVALSFTLLSLPLAPELLLAAAKADALVLSRGVKPLPARLPNPAASDPTQATAGGQKIRVGFVSFDFCMHPVSQLLVNVLEALDRSRTEVFLYSAGPDDRSPMRSRLRAAATEFVDLRGLSDKDAARRVRADGVDLLVDLMGHTRGSRLAVFAHRPAPVQASYLGFAGTTGSDFIDYLVGDPLVTPWELAHQFSEKIAQLPLTFQPNGAGRPLPQAMTRAQAGLPEGAFVMCGFNSTYKITPEVLDTWCGLMLDLPNAVLWLRETNHQLHHNVWRECAARGIQAERVVFARTTSYEDHFSRLALADVFVDSWPYNAHTTASDALWAGVPVVTLYGNGYASRVAASVLNAAGLGELAFATVDDYRRAITALALNPELLAGYRQHLVQQRGTIPLFDAPRYAGELQSLFHRMVQRWRDGLTPEHLLTDAPTN